MQELHAARGRPPCPWRTLMRDPVWPPPIMSSRPAPSLRRRPCSALLVYGRPHGGGAKAKGGARGVGVKALPTGETAWRRGSGCGCEAAMPTKRRAEGITSTTLAHKYMQPHAGVHRYSVRAHLLAPAKLRPNTSPGSCGTAVSRAAKSAPKACVWLLRSDEIVATCMPVQSKPGPLLQMCQVWRAHARKAAATAWARAAALRAYLLAAAMRWAVRWLSTR